MTNNRITFKGSDAEESFQNYVNIRAYKGEVRDAVEKAYITGFNAGRIDRPKETISEMAVKAAHKANDKPNPAHSTWKPKEKTDEEWSGEIYHGFMQGNEGLVVDSIIEMVNAKIADALKGK